MDLSCVSNPRDGTQPVGARVERRRATDRRPLQQLPVTCCVAGIGMPPYLYMDMARHPVTDPFFLLQAVQHVAICVNEVFCQQWERDGRRAAIACSCSRVGGGRN
jgi:hypothetical protein